ncbi:MAG TPA: DUF1559 domain-containing protein [Gemmataceae bacterium]|nr:DUF1559 domain-containing protein [Gemmataceae bacterium]
MCRFLLSLTAALFVLAPARAQPPKDGGADLVPNTAFGFVTVRVSDIQTAETLKPIREALAKLEKAEGGLDRLIGVSVDELDRVTAFWPGLPDDDGRPVVIVRTRGPMNEAKVLKALKAVPVGDGFGRRGGRAGAKPTAVAPMGKAADPAVVPLPIPGPGGPIPPPKVPGPGGDGAQVKDPPPVPRADPKDERPVAADPAPADGPDLYELDGKYTALFVVDERTLLFLPSPDAHGGAELLNLVGQLLRRRADGPLSEALAAADKHTLVAAVRLSQVEGLFSGHEEFPRELVPFRSLLRARTVMVAADVAAKATVTARLTFADAAGARRAEPVLKTLMQLGVDALADQRKQADRDPEWGKVFKPLMEVAAGALDKAEVRTDGSAVVARLEAEVGPALAQAMAGLPDLTEMAASRQKTINNLKQIGIACHNFHDTMNHLPMNVTDPTGKPILSWRVLLLPYLEQDNLYKQLDLTKAWDDPRNARLLEKMPDVFRVYGRSGHEKGLTYFQMPMSPRPIAGGDPFLVPGRRLSLVGIPDGTSNTIMVVEAADGVNWARPDDLRFDQLRMEKVGAPDRKWFHALFADGAVRTLRKDKLDITMLRALMTVNGGEVVTIPEK